MVFGGGIRDFISSLATQGTLGEVLNSASTGYSFVYHMELIILLVALMVVGPLVRNQAGSSSADVTDSKKASGKFGLSDLPT
jgi:MFS transporter, BCD family, chlorophyll transporter